VVLEGALDAHGAQITAVAPARAATAARASAEATFRRMGDLLWLGCRATLTREADRMLNQQVGR
jgi:hypothetical protein